MVSSPSKFSDDVGGKGEKHRPWYMFGGTRWPFPAAKSRKSGRRMALLWPEEDPASDRITNQLMFVPPSSSTGESSGQRLQVILPYYGLGSWFILTPGRDMFRDARCPVDTCTITLNQKQTAYADAIVYHHRFAYPSHPRPQKQVYALKLQYSQGWTKVLNRVVCPVSPFWNLIFEFCSEAETFCDFPPTLHVNAAIEPSKCDEIIILFSCPFYIYITVNKRNEYFISYNPRSSLANPEFKTVSTLERSPSSWTGKCLMFRKTSIQLILLRVNIAINCNLLSLRQ
jgi:hypothetical protein